MASLTTSPRLTRWDGLVALVGGALAAALTLFPGVHIGGRATVPPYSPERVEKSSANFCRLLWLGVEPVESGFATSQLQPQVSSSISSSWGYPNELAGPDIQLVYPAHRAR